MSFSRNFRKLVPIANRVLVEKTAPPAEPTSKIILSTKTETPNVGTIIAVGPGEILSNGARAPVEFNVGDRVLLPQMGGTMVELEGGEFFLFRETELLGKLQDLKE